MRFCRRACTIPGSLLAGGSLRSFRVIAFSYRAILYCFLACLSRVDSQPRIRQKKGRGGTIARAASYKEGMGVVK